MWEELFAHGELDRFGQFNAKFLDVYHPLKDEWSVVNLSGTRSKDVLFVAQGKLHSMLNESEIHSYTAEENSWTQLHSFSFSFIGPSEFLVHILTADLATDDPVVCGPEQIQIQRYDVSC